jgi:hypothetical protein
MRSMVAAAAAGTDQPAATAAKIKTASHTKFRTRPAAGTDQPAATAPKIKTASHTKFRTRPHRVVNGYAPDLAGEPCGEASGARRLLRVDRNTATANTDAANTQPGDS